MMTRLLLSLLFINHLGFSPLGAVALNWWRMRRMRNQLGLHGVRGDLERGIVMRTRATKTHPLPVDILNTYPVEHYSPSIIKNASCAICLDDFTPEKDNIRILPCGHGFCSVCIGKTSEGSFQSIFVAHMLCCI